MAVTCGHISKTARFFLLLSQLDRKLLLDNHYHIFVLHLVGQAHPLRAELGAPTPRQSILEVRGQSSDQNDELEQFQLPEDALCFEVNQKMRACQTYGSHHKHS